jgi:hypothetical protein
MKAKPTRRNIVFFAIVFQICPLLLWGLASLVNPNPTIQGVIGIFAIAQVVLVALIMTWLRKARVEVHDEREVYVQLKVRSLMLNVTTVVAILSIFLSVGIFHEMPAWLAMGSLIVAMLITEQIGYRIFH